MTKPIAPRAASSSPASPHPEEESPTAEAVAELFDPMRLRQARRLGIRTKQALAAEVGVSAAAISQYESGVHKPGPLVVRSLANALDVPMTFFITGRPLTSLDSSDAHFRSLRSTTVGQRNKALAFTEQAWELTHALENWVQFPAVNLPDLELPANQERSRATIRAAAETLRKQWSTPLDTPFPHLTRTAETHGVVVILANFAAESEVQRIDAFSTNKPSRPIVVTPPDRTTGVFKHRFNLAHELGHLLLHGDEVHGETAIEREANTFAGELLMPERSMRNLLTSRIDWDRLSKLSITWGVDMKALVYRSRELGMLSDASARRAYQRLETMRSSGLLTPAPTAQYAGEVPVLLSRAFEYAQSQGVSTKSLADQLHWHQSAVQRFLAAPADPRPQLRALL